MYVLCLGGLYGHFRAHRRPSITHAVSEHDPNLDAAAIRLQVLSRLCGESLLLRIFREHLAEFIRVFVLI